MRRTLSYPDALFNVEQETISTAAITNQGNWGLDTHWLNNEFIPRKTRWVNAYAAYLPRETRTPLLTFEKNASKKEYESHLLKLIKILQASTLVTDDDRKAIGIYIAPPHRTPHPPPTTLVEFEFDTSVIRRLTLHFHDAGSASRAKPRGALGADIRWAIRDTPPIEVEELWNSGFATRTPFMLEFKDSERGKTVYFCLRWENTTGQKGPWNEIKSAIIP
jgi:hypothetical protein